MSTVADLASRFLTAPDDVAMASARLLTINAGGAAASTAYLELCRLLGEATEDGTALLQAADTGAIDLIDRIGALVIACFTTVQASYPSRPDAQAARASLAARADDVVDAAGAAFGADLYSWLLRLTGEAAIQISKIAATRAPLVRVETGLSLPSSLIAFDLYGDPSRGEELVARNRTGTPFAMPVLLEAVRR